MNQLERTLTSLEVSEMVGREHYDVMKDIRRIIQHLGEGTSSVTYFIENNYKDVQGKERPSFNLTKKGCELYATRMTGEKGTQFAVQYIERFNEMEKHLSQPKVLSEKEQIKASMKLTLEASEMLDQHNERILYLEETMRINSGQEFHLNRLGKQKVLQSLGGYKSPAYEEMSSKVFARFWRDFKQHFVIPRYSDLPKVKFDDGVAFIKAWQPDTSTRLEIDSINRQQTIRGVI